MVDMDGPEVTILPADGRVKEADGGADRLVPTTSDIIIGDYLKRSKRVISDTTDTQNLEKVLEEFNTWLKDKLSKELNVAGEDLTALVQKARSARITYQGYREQVPRLKAEGNQSAARAVEERIALMELGFVNVDALIAAARRS